MTSSSPHVPHRRRWPRVVLFAQIRFTLPVAFSGACYNLSRGGLAFVSLEDVGLRVGDELEFTLLVEHGQPTPAVLSGLIGRVVWRQNAEEHFVRYGVCFVRLLPDLDAQLAAIVGDTSPVRG